MDGWMDGWCDDDAHSDLRHPMYTGRQTYRNSRSVGSVFGTQRSELVGYSNSLVGGCHAAGNAEARTR